MVLGALALGVGAGCRSTVKAAPRPSAEQVIDQALADSTLRNHPPIDGLPPEAPTPALPLRVVARSRNAKISLHAVPGQELVVQAGAHLATTRGGHLHLEVPSGGAHEGDGDGMRLAGRWPEDGWTIVRGGAPGPTRFRSYHWGSGKVQREPAAVDEFYADVSPWTNGQLALVGSSRTGTAAFPSARFEVPGKIPAKTPHLLDSAYCWERSTSLVTGEVFALGRSCKGAKPALTRWAPGEAKGVLHVLPGVDWDTVFDLDLGPVVARAPNDVYVSATYKRAGDAAKPYVVHHDGVMFQVVAIPTGRAAVTSLALEPDGALWISMTDGIHAERAIDREGEIWGRSAEGRWKQAVLPKPPGAAEASERWVFRRADGRYRMAPTPAARAYSPSEVYVGQKGDLWVSAVLSEGDDEDWVLFHKGPESTPLDFPDGVRKLPPAHDPCATYFVSMGPLAAVAPSSTTFPGIRGVLAGHADIGGIELIETTSGGKRVVGIFTVNGAVAGRVSKLLARLAPGLTPQATCESPVATRVIPFNAQTGETLD